MGTSNIARDDIRFRVRSRSEDQLYLVLTVYHGFPNGPLGQMCHEVHPLSNLVKVPLPFAEGMYRREDFFPKGKINPYNMDKYLRHPFPPPGYGGSTALPAHNAVVSMFVVWTDNQIARTQLRSLNSTTERLSIVREYPTQAGITIEELHKASSDVASILALPGVSSAHVPMTLSVHKNAQGKDDGYKVTVPSMADRGFADFRGSCGLRVRVEPPRESFVTWDLTVNQDPISSRAQARQAAHATQPPTHVPFYAQRLANQNEPPEIIHTYPSFLYHEQTRARSVVVRGAFELTDDDGVPVQLSAFHNTMTPGRLDARGSPRPYLPDHDIVALHAQSSESRGFSTVTVLVAWLVVGGIWCLLLVTYLVRHARSRGGPRQVVRLPAK